MPQDMSDKKCQEYGDGPRTVNASAEVDFRRRQSSSSLSNIDFFLVL